MSHPRTAILVKLPRKTVAEIRRRSRSVEPRRPYWAVVDDAVMRPEMNTCLAALTPNLRQKSLDQRRETHGNNFVRRDPIEVRVKREDAPSFSQVAFLKRNKVKPPATRTEAIELIDGIIKRFKERET